MATGSPKQRTMLLQKEYDHLRDLKLWDMHCRRRELEITQLFPPTSHTTAGSLHCTFCVYTWCVCVCVCELSNVQLFVTVARQSPLSTGFSRQEYWSGFPFLPLGDLTHPGIEPESPELASVFLTIEPPAKPYSALWGEAKPSTWAGISCERLRAYFEQVRTSDYDS